MMGLQRQLQRERQARKAAEELRGQESRNCSKPTVAAQS